MCYNLERYKAKPRLNVILKNKGITQSQLCKMTGMNTATVSRFDRVIRHEDSHVFTIAKALNISADELFTVLPIIWDESDNSQFKPLIEICKRDAGSKVEFTNEYDGARIDFYARDHGTHLRLAFKNKSPFFELRDFDFNDLETNGYSALQEIYKLTKNNGYKGFYAPFIPYENAINDFWKSHNFKLDEKKYSWIFEIQDFI